MSCVITLVISWGQCQEEWSNLSLMSSQASKRSAEELMVSLSIKILKFSQLRMQDMNGISGYLC